MRPLVVGSCVRSLAIVALAATLTQAQQQQQQPPPQPAARGTIRGTVTDAAGGQPLAAAQVAVVGTAYGAQTDAEGRFTITGVSPGVVRLQATRIGYSPQLVENVRVSLGQPASVAIAMQAQALRLQSVVTVGVSDPTSGSKAPISVARLSGDDIPVPTAGGNPVSMLKGKVAGLSVRSFGPPGSGDTLLIQLRNPVSIRSDLQPMLIIDGVIMPDGSLRDIEPQDIASVEVVRGAAAAALYGSRAAAGVIQISTNRGRDIPNATTRVTVRSEAGFSELGHQVPINRHHNFLVDGQNNYIDYLGNPVPYASRVLDSLAFMDNAYGGQTFDHVDQMFGRGEAITGRFTLGWSSLGTNFQTTAASSRNAGIMVAAGGTERYSLRVNLDHRVGDRFNIAVGAFVNREFTDEITGSSVFEDMLRIGPEIDLFAVRAGYDPAGSDPSARWVVNPDPLNTTIVNPFYREFINDSFEKRSGLQMNVDATYRLTQTVSVSALIGYLRSDEYNSFYLPTGLVTTENTVSAGSYDLSSGFDESVNGDIRANYIQGFGDLTIRATARMLGQVQQGNTVGIEGDTLTIRNSRDISNAILTDNLDGATGSPVVRKSRDLVGTVAFDYAGKYVVEGLVRRDGNSQFGSHARYKTNVRGSAAWRLSDEAWWPVPSLSLAKLRYSIGSAGNPPQFTDQYDRFGTDGQRINRLTIGNPLLRPESVVEQEMGIDLSYRDRISLELTHARQKATELLRSNPILSFIGFDNRIENVGDLEGTSYEATLESYWINTPRFRWNSTLVADRQRARVTKWNRYGTCAQDRTRDEWSCASAVFGEQFGNEFVTRLDHLRSLHQNPTSLEQFDINDDGYVVAVGPNGSWEDGRWGQIVSIDGVNYKWGFPIVRVDSLGNRTFEKWGQALPHFQFGLQNSFWYRGFQLFTSFTGQHGGYAYNDTRQVYLRRGVHGDVDQSGKPDHRKKPSTYYTDAVNASGANSSVNGGLSVNDAAQFRNFFEKAHYLKVDELALSYTFRRFPALLATRLPVTSGNIGIVGRNLHTWTPYTGYDPEVGSDDGSPSDRWDTTGYPRFRTFTFQVGLSF